MSTGRNPKFEWQDAFIQADVKPSAFKVGQAICNRWNGDNNQPYASAPYLVKITGLSRATVMRALRELREEGWIAQVSRGGYQRATASRWRLTVPHKVSPGIHKVSPEASQGLTGETLVDLPSRPVEVDTHLRFSVDRPVSAATPPTPPEVESICARGCRWLRTTGEGGCSSDIECKERLWKLVDGSVLTQNGGSGEW